MIEALIECPLRCGEVGARCRVAMAVVDMTDDDNAFNIYGLYIYG